MKIEKSKLLDSLKEMTNKHLKMVGELESMPASALLFRPSPDAWNVLECMEHLVRYGKFYIPEMEKRLNKSSDENNPVFKSGLLGNKFAMMMLPNTRMKKIKTFKNMDPLNSRLDKSVLATLRQQLNALLRIMDQASKKNLNKIKTAISISAFIKLRLGDTLRVVIYHNERHMVQAKKIIESQQVLHPF